jgi:hypothetical protein
MLRLLEPPLETRQRRAAGGDVEELRRLVELVREPSLRLDLGPRTRHVTKLEQRNEAVVVPLQDPLLVAGVPRYADELRAISRRSGRFSGHHTAGGSRRAPRRACPGRRAPSDLHRLVRECVAAAAVELSKRAASEPREELRSERTRSSRKSCPSTSAASTASMSKSSPSSPRCTADAKGASPIKHGGHGGPSARGGKCRIDERKLRA